MATGACRGRCGEAGHFSRDCPGPTTHLVRPGRTQTVSSGGRGRGQQQQNQRRGPADWGAVRQGGGGRRGGKSKGGSGGGSGGPQLVTVQLGGPSKPDSLLNDRVAWLTWELCCVYRARERRARRARWRAWRRRREAQRGAREVVPQCTPLPLQTQLTPLRSALVVVVTTDGRRIPQAS